MRCLAESKSGESAHLLRRFGKGFAAALALIVIGVVVFAFFIPQGAAIIPLKVSYTVGETLIYNTTNTGTDGGFNYLTNQLQMDQNVSSSQTDTQVVQSFNGQTYSINHTVNVNVEGPQPAFTFTFNQQLNSTGYSEILAPGVTSNQPGVNQTSVDPVLAFLASPQARVGETEVIPITQGNADEGMTGNVTVTFVDIQDVTVPAGTFHVFRVDSSSSNTTQTFQHSLFEEGSMTETESFTEQSYVEYDTGKLVESVENLYSVLTLKYNSTLPDVHPPILVDNLTMTTQLTDDVMPGQPLPTPTPNPAAAQQQAATDFLQDVSGLDMSYYTIQSQEPMTAGFYKCTLTSSGSSLDTVLNFNSQGKVNWCQLYPIQGSPIFTNSSSNMAAATAFLANYGNYADADYIPSLQGMLGNVTGNASTTVTSGTNILTVTAGGDTLNLVWTNSQNSNDKLILTIQNGGLDFFNADWT